MRKLSIITNFLYKTLLILSIGLSSQACNSCSRVKPLENPANETFGNDNKPSHKIFIVCSHGMGEDAASMQPWIDSFMKEDWGAPVTAIAINRPSNKPSSLEDQAKELLAKILEEARKKDMCSPDAYWFLVGNSQGGVVQLLAYLSMDEATKKFVRGLISRNSPLCGAPGIKPNFADLTKIDNQIGRFIPGFSITRQVLIPLLGNGPGSRDLDVLSPVMQKIKTTPTTKAPLLCLSGDLGSSDILDVFLKLIEPSLSIPLTVLNLISSTLTPTLNNIIGPNNDGLVPRSSQEGQGLQNTNKVVKYFPGSHHFVPFPGSEPYKAAVAFIKEQVTANANK